MHPFLILFIMYGNACEYRPDPKSASVLEADPARKARGTRFWVLHSGSRQLFSTMRDHMSDQADCFSCKHAIGRFVFDPYVCRTRVWWAFGWYVDRSGNVRKL